MTNSWPAPRTPPVLLGPDLPAAAAGNGRRNVLSTLIAAVGATAGAVALGRTVHAGDDDSAPVGGNALELGLDNTSDRPTTVLYDGVVAIQDAQFRGASLLAAGQVGPNGADGNDVFPGAIGGYGKGYLPNGVHGSTVNPTGYGIVAANLAISPGASGPAPKGLGVASSSGPQIHFMPMPGAVVGPTPGVHTRGELYVDAEGAMWFTVPAFGGGIRWMRIAAPTSAGAYHTIDPARAYDSRQPGYAQRGPLVPGEVRGVSVSDGHDASGATTRPGVVPPGATAAMLNVTVADSTGANFVSIVAGGRGSSETSTVNWPDGTTQLSNGITVPISLQRTIDIICGDQSGAADVIIDVFGYYL